MREGESLLSSSSFSPSPLKRVSLRGARLLFLAWNILLFVLIVVALAKKPHTVHNHNYSNNPSVITQLSTPQGVQVGDVVSIDVNGNLVLGAGLSIYLNSSVLDAQDSLKHLVVTSLSSSMVVAAFVTNNVAKVAVGFVNGVEISWNAPTTIGINTVDSIITLSPSLVVVTGSPYLLAVYISADGTVAQGQRQQFAQISVNPETAPLSSTSFALSYYQSVAGSYVLSTVACTVSSALQITMTSPLTYAGDQVSHGVLPLTSTSYLTLYPDLTPASSPSLSGAPLVAQLITILPNFTLSLSPISATLNDSLANFFFASARLSDTRGVVLFVDTSRNNALIAATLELDYENGTGSLAFGSALAINSGDASGVSSAGLWMFIDLIALDSQRFVAAYSDLANEGRVVAVVCELSPNEEIVLASASFVLSDSDPDLDYYWVASTALSNYQFLVMDALSGPTGVTGGKVAFAEMKANPVGVVGKLGGLGDIIVAGVVNVSVPLTKGKYYFATSQGDLVYADGTSDFVLFPRPGQYITSGNVLLSVESLVGIAISENAILLK